MSLPPTIRRADAVPALHAPPRPRLIAAAVSAVAVIVLAAAGCAAPHPGSHPAGGTARVLARAKAASGGARWDAAAALGYSAAIESGGLRGSATGLEDLRAGRSVSRFTLGPVSGAEGHDGRRSWSQEPGGEVSIGSAGDAQVAAANDAWLTARAYWFPTRRPGRVSYRGERAEGGRRFHVVAAAPAGGRAMALWFDAASGLLDRVVDSDGRHTETTTFGDYRPVGGLVLPFSIRVRQGEARFDTVVRVSRYRVDPPVAAGAFDPPRPTLADVAWAGGRHETTIPFELVNNHIYARAEIDGHPVRLLVDTGGANVLTPAAAAAIGLASQGALETEGSGEKSQEQGFARAGSLRLGDVTIAHPVFFTIDLSPMIPVEGVELAGLVGYEIFHRFAVRIDYAGHRLTLIDPRRFDPDSVAGERIPFTWKGQVPVVEAVLDGVAGQFDIDSGSRSSLIVYAGFAARHGLVARYRAAPPRVTGWGVGGPVRSQPARLGDLVLGSLHVRNPTGSIYTGTRGALADRTIAGNIGGGVLRRFTVTFDYARSRMTLEPNRDAARADPADRSGMWMNASPGGTGYQVMDVVRGGPADRAGLRRGDRILELDGEPARFDRLAGARAALCERPAGTRVRVVYLRAGARRAASLTLADEIPPVVPAAPAAGPRPRAR
ncbi:MAG TPA: aspartyl protease family protein [Kofleriaceae bacterium]|nr:aspartyl protease family protein [Kofleriaceae bacterium]